MLLIITIFASACIIPPGPDPEQVTLDISYEIEDPHLRIPSGEIITTPGKGLHSYDKHSTLRITLRNNNLDVTSWEIVKEGLGTEIIPNVNSIKFPLDMETEVYVNLQCKTNDFCRGDRVCIEGLCEVPEQQEITGTYEEGDVVRLAQNSFAEIQRIGESKVLFEIDGVREVIFNGSTNTIADVQVTVNNITYDLEDADCNQSMNIGFFKFTKEEEQNINLELGETVTIQGINITLDDTTSNSVILLISEDSQFNESYFLNLFNESTIQVAPGLKIELLNMSLQNALLKITTRNTVTEDLTLMTPIQVFGETVYSEAMTEQSSLLNIAGQRKLVDIFEETLFEETSIIAYYYEYLNFCEPILTNKKTGVTFIK
ncbi:MAG: hypothetical protein ACLFN8_00040 [Candidatus Woesearchaeota archaeon]